MNIENVKHIGLAATWEGAKILRKYFGKLTGVNKKGAIDLVTEADLESEKAIISIIHTAFPEHSILAEESGLNHGNGEHQWIIDPLDGTTNFAHELNIFAVSIAFSYKDDISLGFVLNPISGELFTAEKGKGAKLNGFPISVSNTQKVSESLLVTGFPYNHPEIIDSIMFRFTRCTKAAQGIRRLGSAALDLCFVACGRFDGFWEQNLKPWDTAAGALIAEEAGARVTDFSGNSYNINQKEILATNNKIHHEMTGLLEYKDQQ
ncbi:MAG: inositol monophosphatase [Desulfobacterales bacterium]|jgi:myo-inositol-1(or 4)-monophosphatase|nr:inositol monophosphatase [Desulfobacterales bacterium]